MKFTKQDLAWAADEGIVSHEQAHALCRALEARHANEPSFTIAHVAYYLGAMLVISGMGWFLNTAWENLGGAALSVVSVLYGVCFTWAGIGLWRQPATKIPGGLLVTMAVSMTPLAVYGLERHFNFWPEGDPGKFTGYHTWVMGSWLLMELSTIVAGLVALRFVRFPFLTAPIAFSLWYLSMDLTPYLFGQHEFTWKQRCWVSVVVGLAMIWGSIQVDRRTREDFAYWGYLFGTIAFWFGLTLMGDGDEFSKFLYCLINVAMLVVSVLLDRRVFIVFGAIGILAYVGHLAERVFRDALLFPPILTIVGIAIIWLGIQLQKYREPMERAILELVPMEWRRALPRERSPVD